RGQEFPVRPLAPEHLRDVELSLWSAGATVSRAVIPEAAGAGTVCVDNSSAFRMDPAIPLVIPEVNPEALVGSPGHRIVANPNCTAITLVMAVAPLHRAVGLRSL